MSCVLQSAKVKKLKSVSVTVWRKEFMMLAKSYERRVNAPKFLSLAELITMMVLL
jgi:hypothetical protein